MMSPCLICLFVIFCNPAGILDTSCGAGSLGSCSSSEKWLKAWTLEFKCQFAVTLGKLFHLSLLGFLRLKNVDDNGTCSAWLFSVTMSLYLECPSNNVWQMEGLHGY